MSTTLSAIVTESADTREDLDQKVRPAASNSIQRNLQHEDRMVMETQKAAHLAQWGTEVEADDMETVNNIRSPVTHNHYQQPERSGSWLRTIGLMALGMAIPGAGVAGYFISDLISDKAPEQLPTIDETVGIGLGKIEDYLEPKP